MKAWLPAAFLPCLLASTLAPAEETEGAKEDGKPKDEATAPGEEHVTVVVTASKHGQKITEAPAAVTVISSDDIAQSGALSVADLFRRIPGLDFSQTSARDFNVNARGFNNLLSRRLLVLVDGRSVYLDLLHFTLWDGIHVTIDDIERIEVVRGPGSALYGANASAGVVNIITKSPRDVETVARVGYGELHTAEASVLTGKKLGDKGFKLAASYYQTDSFENPDRDPDTEFQAGEVATRQPKIYGRFEYELDDASRIVADAGYAASTGTLYTGIGPLDILSGSYSPYARSSWTRGGLYMQVFWNGLLGKTLNLTSLQKNHFTTNAYDYEAQYNFQAGEKHFFVLGGSARYADIASDLTSRDRVVKTEGVYAQDDMKITDRLSGNFALRVDHDDLVGTVLAPKAGLLFTPSPKHTFRVTAATAYNSSSFIEAYLDYGVTPIPSNPDYVVYAKGEPDLKPEKTVSYEIGYRSFPVSKVLLDVNVYRADLEDFKQFIATEFYAPGLPKTYTYINAGTAHETGVELSVEWYATDHWAFYGSYSYLHVSQAPEVSDFYAKNKACVTVQYGSLEGLSGSLSAAYSDKIVFPPSTAFYRSGTIPSYTTLNGSATYAFGGKDVARRFFVGLKGTNLLDNEHREFIAGDIIERKIVAEVGARF